ncbi:MAG: hypothetical protein NZM35_10155 [Chitinophagales bacterium]|nr:hypothetical protein [Chitinophagales bacterium]MDW8419677.1 hypothetical protein [Chitinophagales bacterium]
MLKLFESGTSGKKCTPKFSFVWCRSAVFVWSLLCAVVLHSSAQTSHPHPCSLTDSIQKHLPYIRQQVKRVFHDTINCRQVLLLRIAELYSANRDAKYLDALQYIRVTGDDLVSDLYPDVILAVLQRQFSGFLHDLYAGKGRYYALEKELVICLNMIVEGRPLKQKYLGLFNVEIGKAKDKKDAAKAAYLTKLKTRVEEDKP